MKKLILTAITVLLTQGTFANDFPVGLPFPDLPNPDLIPVREQPGPNSEILKEVLHQKVVDLEVTGFKVTILGYGMPTPKILVPELASHTVFNHRNDGEDAPCLAGAMTMSGEPRVPVNTEVLVRLSNRYVIDRERKICQVHLEEYVEANVAGVKYTHLLLKDMGFRYIGDCPQAEQ